MTCFQVIDTSGSGVKRISLSVRDGVESGAHSGVHPTLYTENFPVTPYRIGMPESQWQSVSNSSPVWVEYESMAEAQNLWLNYVLFQKINEAI